MKVLLCVTIILFCANSASAAAIRAKRGLSPNVQKKLVDELNKARQEMAKKTGIKFQTLTYDKGLEKSLESIDGCEIMSDDHDKPLYAPLKFNNIVAETLKHKMLPASRAQLLGWQLFNPNQTRIGCAKELKCSQRVKADEIMNDELAYLAGKLLEISGACVLGPYRSWSSSCKTEYCKYYLLGPKIFEKGVPRSAAYFGDIIGTPDPTPDVLST